MENTQINNQNKEDIIEVEEKKSPAQEWLDKEYPKEGICQIETNDKGSDGKEGWNNKGKSRDEITKLDISNNKNLEDKLIIQGFPNLEKINCLNNKELTGIKLNNLPKLDYFHGNNCHIKEIVIKNCPNITFFNVSNNLLIDLSFLDNLNPEKLTTLSLHTNNFPEQGLECFDKFINLEQLHLDNCDEERFKKGEYNKFTGSLKPLQNLSKLELLSIGNTNIDSGLEYLPKSFRKIDLSTSWWGRDYGSCYKLRQELEKASQIKGVTEKLKSEKEMNSKGKEDPAWFSDYYRIAPWREVQNLEKVTDSQGAQGWLDKNYPLKPTEEWKKREKVIFLNINGKNLEGELDLKDFVNLKKMDCSFNQLTNLNLSKCKNLTHLNCSWNKFSNTSFLETIPNKEKIEMLKMNNNEKIKENLEFLTPFTGLITSDLENCPFYGSLEPLKDLKKLEQIYISRTHINKGLEYLPENCRELYCDYDPQYKSIEIVGELSKFAKDRYYEVTKWRIDKANNVTVLAIPLERLFIIRRDIEEFIRKWGEDENDIFTEISKLQDPRKMWKNRLVIYGTRFTSQVSTVAGTALTLQPDGIKMGIGILAVAPFTELISWKLEEELKNKEEKWNEFVSDSIKFLDNYHELLGILKKIKIGEWGKVNQVLSDLNEKTKEFLKVYDRNYDEKIDISELISERERFGEELDKMEEVVEAVRKLESEIIKYKQIKSIEDEKRVKEKEEVLTTDELFRKTVNEISKKIKIDRETKKKIRAEIKNKKEFATREIVFLLKKEEKQFLVISRGERNIFSNLLPDWLSEKCYLDLIEEKDGSIKISNSSKFNSEDEAINGAIGVTVEKIGLTDEQKKWIRKKIEDEKKEKGELEEEKGWGKLDKELAEKIKEMIRNLEINTNTEWDKYSTEEPIASTSKNNSSAQLLEDKTVATGSTSQPTNVRKRNISNPKENRPSQEIYELVDLQSKEELQTQIEIPPK